MLFFKVHAWILRPILTGGGTGEASEATASPEFRGFTTEKFLASWMYERGNFSCFTGKKLVPLPLDLYHYCSICTVGLYTTMTNE